MRGRRRSRSSCRSARCSRALQQSRVRTSHQRHPRQLQRHLPHRHQLAGQLLVLRFYRQLGPKGLVPTIAIRVCKAHHRPLRPRLASACRLRCSVSSTRLRRAAPREAGTFPRQVAKRLRLSSPLQPTAAVGRHILRLCLAQCSRSHLLPVACPCRRGARQARGTTSKPVPSRRPRFQP